MPAKAPEQATAPGTSLRLFVALEMPPDVQQVAVQVQAQLRDVAPHRTMRWVTDASFHITLKFLGDTPAQRIATIEAALSRLRGHAPFTLTLAGLGAFPNWRSPNVVWIGAGGAVGALHRLRDDVEQHLAPLGYPTEARPFSPHLTLGRAYPNANRAALSIFGEKISGLRIEANATWTVTHVVLMRSDHGARGAVYSAVTSVALQ
jgi:RNA 2',3'-cyclic 3'-phosphodiesterase